MNRGRSALVLLALVAFAQGIGFRGLTYKGLKEPEVERRNSRNPIEKWIQQPVDHFNHRDNRTWSMRFYENDEFFNGTGAILIMLGGEWPIQPGFLLTGQMFDIAKTHGALMFYTEHRYYGFSQPVENTEAKNLQYLNVDQALADVAFFIESAKKDTPGLSNSSVVVFGGSYAGNMAAWARLKYPHLVQGAVASSAPVLAKADFFEYYQVVANALANYDEQCARDVKEAFDTIQNLILLPDGSEILKRYLWLCDTPDTLSSISVAYLLNAMTEVFASIVQYNRHESNGETSVGRLCDKMMDTAIEKPIMRLGRYLADGDCVDPSYKHFVQQHKNTTWNAPAYNVLRLWLYQTCTEYGYYQTTNAKQSIFGDKVTVQFFVQICTDLYGDYYDEKLLNSSVRRTNVIYGGSLPDVKNVVFVNGNVDPWHALSVLEDLNKDSPAILIDGSSHCEDLYSDLPSDVPGLTEARKRVRSIVANWLTWA